ncbi:DUF4231 domain-containing protein [Micromonospora carbonacea]|uniref:DUF4231 domain-containing protein n=1 Tax=Micromonospora carbonacea TaxID=47853 RepID=UPI003717289D
MPGESLHQQSLIADGRAATRQFADELNRIRGDLGNPSIDAISAKLKELGRELPDHLLAATFSGDYLPSYGVAGDIVDALEILSGGKQKPKVNTSDLQLLHRAAVVKRRSRNPTTASNVQSSVFQTGRSYAYIAGRDIVVGSDDAATSTGSADDTAMSHASDYLEELEREVTAVAKAARRRLAIYRILRFAALAASAVTPAVALLDAAPWITASVGTVAFLSEGSIQLTRINERAVLDTRRVTALSREFRMYRTRVGEYASGDTFTLLVKRVEEIREQNDSERLDVVQQSFGSQVPPVGGDRPRIIAGGEADTRQ